ncbi:DUF4391 domain-containing protein [Pseudomonas jilinensis]|uniref:DUF4391 domain-containing protein n=1 Tax=Pseudomonas jilinensis TaxID=2078689 RepID=A0A396S814_9PSED|nr:DUF4391 domain-containing protein [Pseudomonas jilinensis]RHW22321.1 DUF4391 domain-containing protein [Pseudomonas jilinensis]
MTLYAWPKQAAFGRVVPKSKIYEHAAVSAALKERFVLQVEQINWAYKLAPETVNLPATPAVTEIQVFRLNLRGASLDQEVLKAIDRAIPFPLIFELVQGGRIKLVAAYKRPAQNPKSDADISIVGNYLETNWCPRDTPRQSLPVALDMNGLYEQLLLHMMPIPARSEESLADAVGRVEQLRARQREIDKVAARLKREKQFNRKVEMNAELRRMKAELERLK